MASDESDFDMDAYLLTMRSQQDLELARSVPSHECPRRYCFWWCWLRFNWEVSVQDGCAYMEAVRVGLVPEGYPERELPCCRADEGSPTDHFEPRIPALIEDGLDEHENPWSRWWEEHDGKRHYPPEVDQ